MSKNRLLVVDDEEGILEVIADTLCDIPDVDLVLEKTSSRAAAALATSPFDLLITDLRMPKPDGVELLELAREHDPELPVLVLTAYPSIESAVGTMKLGAIDYLTKPFIPADLFAKVTRVLAQSSSRTRIRRHPRAAGDVFDDIIGVCPAMCTVFDTIQRVAATSIDVLIAGEPGTGKELVARSIHKRSSRAMGRFVSIDCGAIPESALERELFGHESGFGDGRGSGLLELADGGTLFLDEVAEMPLHLQAKLLRVLQQRSFRRTGAADETQVDLRVVAATNRDLATEVREGRLRQDLFYRISVVRIALPRLHDREEDLPILVDRFVMRYANELNKGESTVAPEVVEILSRYEWPGNVRELQSVLKRAVALSPRTELTAEDLPDEVVIGASASRTPEVGGYFQLRAQRVAAFEKDYLTALMERYEGDVPHAASEARVPRGTMYRLLKKYELSPDRFR